MCEVDMFRFMMLVTLGSSPLGCLESACTVYCAKKNEIRLPAATKWETPPVVQVCDTAPVTKDEVNLLLDEWEKHGAPKLKVVESKCEGGDPLPGYVQIDQWRPEWRMLIPGAFAVTVVWPPDQEAGLIMVPDGNMGVLRHELGHLWIPDHTSSEGHVLCPYVDCIGDGWGGVKKSFRKGGY